MKKSFDQNVPACWNAQTCTLTIDGKWSFNMFRKAMSYLALTDVEMKKLKIVIPSDSRLTLEEREIRPVSVYVADNGKLITRGVRLPKVVNDGVCCFRRKSDIERITNDGQVHVESNSRIGTSLLHDTDKEFGRGVYACENFRHIKISNKSYMYGVYCHDISSLEVSNSFVVDCEAHDKTSVDAGTGFFIGCKGKLAQYSYTGINTPEYKKLQDEQKLWISVIHFNAQTCNRVMYIGVRPASVQAEQADIEKLLMLTYKKRPALRLSADLARHFNECAILTTAVQDRVKKHIYAGKGIKYPYK